MIPATIEERLQALEKEVAEIKQMVSASANGDQRNWLERISGSLKDDPEFDEVLRLGREHRKADRP